MQVVILAGGKGVRLQPITHHVPKPIIKIAGKALIEHNIDKLPDIVDEIIVVVSYLKEQIINYLGGSFKGRKVIYVEQKKTLGTAHALFKCEKYLKDAPFMVMMADDIYSEEDLITATQYKEPVIFYKKLKSKFVGGNMIMDDKGRLVRIKEGKHKRGGRLNTALYVLDKGIFSFKVEKISADSKEYGLPQTIAKNADHYKIRMQESGNWTQISDIDDLIRAEKTLLKKTGCKAGKSYIDYFK